MSTQITTPDALAALPAGTPLLDRNGHVAQVAADHLWGAVLRLGDLTPYRLDSDAHMHEALEIHGPFTVLVPAQTAQDIAVQAFRDAAAELAEVARISMQLRPRIEDEQFVADDSFCTRVHATWPRDHLNQPDLGGGNLEDYARLLTARADALAAGSAPVVRLDPPPAPKPHHYKVNIDWGEDQEPRSWDVATCYCTRPWRHAYPA